MAQRKLISCIIPAFNEAERIGEIIKVAKSSPMVGEIIVINDGSTDNTSKVISKFKGIKIIDYSKNKGKSFAVLQGIKSSKNKILLLLDSDLIGLKSSDLNKLIEPVVKGKADVSISMRANGRSKIWKKLWKYIGVDPLSGERVFHKRILGDINHLKKINRYEIEMFLNRKIIESGLSVKIVQWDNVIGPWKSQKLGNVFLGTKDDLLMMMQIFKSAGIFGLAYSTYHLKKLSIPKDRRSSGALRLVLESLKSLNF
jgi:glycosyltransferase involved in cell wall biosynthesis